MKVNKDNLENKALKLDAKDRKILAELFEDARAPFSVVARRVKLGKEAVNYRVKRLMRTGLLAGFNTVIDVKRLGWEMFFVYIRLRNIDSEKESEVLGFLERHPNVAQLFRCMGGYDAIIKVFVRHHTDVDLMMKKIEERFRDSFDHYDIDCIVDEAAVPFAFLYDVDRGGEPKYVAGAPAERVEVSDFELRMLKELAKNARLGFSELASKLKAPVDNVKYHMRKLEKSGVILNYRPDILPKKLGYSWYLLILKTSELSRQANTVLESFLLNNPNVTYFYRTVRSSDVQIELRAKSSEKLNEVIMSVRGILKDFLKRAELIAILDERKYTYFPDCLIES